MLYMFLIVLSTTNLADIVNPHENSGAAIKHYLLVCSRWTVVYSPIKGFFVFQNIV